MRVLARHKGLKRRLAITFEDNGTGCSSSPKTKARRRAQGTAAKKLLG
jgi:hypothetical protein